MARVLRGLPRYLVGLLSLLVVMLAAAAPPAGAAGSGTSDALKADLTSLVGQLSGGGSSAPQVHMAKAKLIVAAYDDQVGGVSAARVIGDLDCISLNVQKARGTSKRSTVRARFAGARGCSSDLAKRASAGGANGLASDLASVGATLKAMGAKAVAGKAFGAKATALRKTQSSIVARRFVSDTLHGVPFNQVYDDLECIDVKVEAGRASGAASCAKRLLRRSTSLAPAKDPVTFGSDLTGAAVTLPDRFAPDDTEFWTSALTVPAAGTITAFRLKTGDSPVDLPLRFSVVRPQGDGTVVVVTTTNPVYPLAAHDAGVHTYPTSGLSFACCKVKAGDIVTVDNSGTTTPGAYVWFAARSDMTTLSHTSNGDSQNAGVVWSPITHAGYEVLLQVVLQPE
ncbi:hypothetical protein [Baekduia sp.]|jgi:hypothetical protein|uniref:hypothetical protein n=1 Tax=Baekduia sp. TaxID=2600305 RepID=UPI002DFA5D3D|nr:hypothetical protein [Baekduia sp.]